VRTIPTRASASPSLKLLAPVTGSTCRTPPEGEEEVVGGWPTVALVGESDIASTCWWVVGEAENVVGGDGKAAGSVGDDCTVAVGVAVVDLGVGVEVGRSGVGVGVGVLVGVEVGVGRSGVGVGVGVLVGVGVGVGSWYWSSKAPTSQEPPLGQGRRKPAPRWSVVTAVPSVSRQSAAPSTAGEPGSKGTVRVKPPYEPSPPTVLARLATAEIPQELVPPCSRLVPCHVAAKPGAQAGTVVSTRSRCRKILAE